MFSAKLNAFASILLVWIFMRYQYATLRRSRLPQRLRSKPPFVRYRQIYSCKVKPPLSKFLVMSLIKEKHLDFFYVKIIIQASE